jgi:hypothetical protein
VDRVKVIVTGDVAVDRVIAHASPSKHAHWTDQASYVSDLRGGACLLAELIAAAAGELATYMGTTAGQPGGQPFPATQIIGPDFEKLQSKCGSDARTTYGIWEPYPRVDPPDGKKDAKVWRASHYLGRNRHPGETCTAIADVLPPVEGAQDADLVVLDDGGFGFRDDQGLWPSVITKPLTGLSPWILLKMSRPIARGQLWDRLFERFAKRMVVIMTVSDLRLTEVKISREFSWEQTAGDLAWELAHNPTVNALSECAYVVVSFGAAGAVLMSRGLDDNKEPKFSPLLRPESDRGFLGAGLSRLGDRSHLLPHHRVGAADAYVDTCGTERRDPHAALPGSRHSVWPGFHSDPP